MSNSYKKFARKIPDWAKYRKQALFEGPGLQTYVHWFDESRDRHPEAYPFLATLESQNKLLFHFLQTTVYWTGSGKDTHYFSEPILELPRIRSKKKRTQNHAILVALSNTSRRNVRFNNGGPKAKGAEFDIDLPEL